MRVRAVLRAAVFTPREKLLLLLLNAWPLAHLVATICLATLPPWPLAWRLVAAFAGLLLVPPLLCRLIVGGGLASGEIAVPSRTFFRWWATWQLQMIFNRLPWLEEMLRFVPALYSTWLRLWGARLGRLTLWSPGVRIFDRPLLRIGDDVVLGLDVRIVGHFGSVDADGRATFILGPITIGDRATLGAAALLAPGVVIESDQCTEALFLGPPFTHWRGGERVPPSAASRHEPLVTSTPP
jgi:hypothetical protein